MFATMVIALPSEHTGGEVVVHLGNETRTLETAPASAFGTSYLAWYADVNHAVKPVRSGYRLVLTYNLLHKNDDYRSHPTILDDHKSNLSNVLAEWQAGLDGDEVSCSKLVYLLEHQYSEANIGMSRLKGQDQDRARLLIEAAQQNEFCVFLAHFQHSVTGGCEDSESGWAGGSGVTHEIWDEYDPEWKLTKVFMPDGQHLADELDIDEDDIVQSPDFEDAEPDDEDFEGWTGNEGATATHFYHRTCLIVVPKSSRADFLSEAKGKTLGPLLDVMLNELNQAEIEEPLKNEIVEVCSLVAGTVPH